MACSWTTHTEYISVYPLQQCVREGATVLRYTYIAYLFFSLALQPKCGLDSLFAKFSKSHIIRYTHPVGLPWTSDQLVAEAATCTTCNKHNRKGLFCQRDSNSGSQPWSTADVGFRHHAKISVIAHGILPIVHDRDGNWNLYRVSFSCAKRNC